MAPGLVHVRAPGGGGVRQGKTGRKGEGEDQVGKIGPGLGGLCTNGTRLGARQGTWRGEGRRV